MSDVELEQPRMLADPSHQVAGGILPEVHLAGSVQQVREHTLALTGSGHGLTPPTWEWEHGTSMRHIWTHHW